MKVGEIKMTTKEFLKRYDNKKYFTESELKDLWWGDLIDEYIPVVGKEEYAEPDSILLII